MNERGNWRCNRGGYKQRDRGNRNGHNSDWKSTGSRPTEKIPMIVDTRFSANSRELQFPKVSCVTAERRQAIVHNSSVEGSTASVAESPHLTSQNKCFKPAQPADVESIPFLDTQRKFHFEGDNPYFCAGCFKGYSLREHYIRHLQQHVQCNSEGCQFVGTPNVVEKHFNNMHFFHLKKPSVEGAERYRNERKRNFPVPNGGETSVHVEPQTIQTPHISLDMASDSDESPLEIAIDKKPEADFENEPNKVERLMREADSIRVPKSDLFPKRRKTVNATVLENLLHDEIEHERSVLLQCICHLINNRFYDEIN